MNVDVSRCSCGTAGLLRTLPALEAGPVVRVLTCPKCDRLACGACGAVDFSGTRLRCSKCGVRVESLIEAEARNPWPWQIERWPRRR